jgi:phosphonate transport system substrate-binding protein
MRLQEQKPSQWLARLVVLSAVWFPLVLTNAEADSLVLGSVSSKPAEEMRNFLPLAHYLAGQLKSVGIDKGEVRIAKTAKHMAKYMKRGKVDVYIDSPFPVLAASMSCGSKFLVRRWKKGVGEYQSVIFVRKDSGIDDLKGLVGKIISFEEPASSSGYLFPLMALTKSECDVAEMADASDTPEKDEIGFVFSGENENTMLWVLKKKVQAGALDNQSFLKLSKTRVGELKIIGQTGMIPRHIVSCRADLAEPIVARLKEVLIGMENSEEGKKVLLGFQKTLRFDKLPDSASEIMEEARAFINEEL